MSNISRYKMLAVGVACGFFAISNVDWSYRPILQIDPSLETTQSTGSPREPITPAAPPDDVRKSEIGRRAVRPAGDPQRENGWALNYEGVLNGRVPGQHPRPAEPMPPTYCRSIERAPENDSETYGPHHVQFLTYAWFEDQSGFGFRRMSPSMNGRGVKVALRVIDRVELVSLLTDDDPSVYVLDEIATPPLARQAKRRPLDEFERLGLNAVRSGEGLVWTREAPTRMFGAIRARGICLDCHVNAKRGDLLGAFTYYLTVPVDRLCEVKGWR